VDALSIFADNLHHSNRGMRVSTLKILCHHELLSCVDSTNDQPVEKQMKTEVSQTSLVDSHGNNVCFCLYSCRYCRLTPCSD
jgi:U3 small nucleolar RNA-associated protein 20